MLSVGLLPRMNRDEIPYAKESNITHLNGIGTQGICTEIKTLIHSLNYINENVK